MRTFGFAPHIFCGVDRNVLTTAGYPYPTLAYYHQQEPRISSHPPYSDLHGYMSRFDYGTAGVAVLSNALYRCSCNGQHSFSSQASSLFHHSPFSYSCDSNQYLPGNRDESSEEQRISSIATLRIKAKEYELSNIIKPDYDEKERLGHVI